jgi:hypothetical protein
MKRLLLLLLLALPAAALDFNDPRAVVDAALESHPTLTRMHAEVAAARERIEPASFSDRETTRPEERSTPTLRTENMKKLLAVLALTFPLFANTTLFTKYESVRQSLLFGFFSSSRA